MTKPPRDTPPPFELTPPDAEEIEKVWVKPHERLKGGKYVKVPGHWRVKTR